ncbi:hypothetical protein CHS0354_037444 [Potamilus streckersoni]|uniref:K Homology domain-containing protein n=1 Tax=Potamilus streckersoni TaxID=2493646 RepID=A0AAE0VY97_9BIVA|nr:hypothetical protein CHS0354_037444 [Potamilus streckersoni]
MATHVPEVRNVDEEAYIPPVPPSYDEAFPQLPMGQSFPPRTPAKWNMTVKSSKCTQVFQVPLEERRFKDMDEYSFGEEGEQAKICKEIMARTGVSIEMSLARDQSLTVVITGKEDAVKKARRDVMTRLQTQANVTLKIPRDHHGFILGRNGAKIQELELATATKISFPRPDENSDVIRIVGTKEGIDKARHELLLVSEEQAKLAFERLPIEKIYHPFVCGPNNTIIKQLMDETGAKINVPPLSVQKDEIAVSGEKDGVNRCKATIMSIYNEKKRKCQTVSVEVRKSQHKYVIGPRGTNLHEILAVTGVSVEVPPYESPSETITLRGEQEKLGPALTMVYSKANSVIFADVHAPEWLHKFIIGKKGENIRRITQDCPKVHVEFSEGQEKIQVEGPPEEVEQAVAALQSYVKDLESRMDFAEIEIEQRFHKHVIGKGGANITRIKNETGVMIRIPPDAENSSIIRIEGDPAGVQRAKEELMEMSSRMENEKTKDVIIDQRFHKNIIGAKGEKIRGIRDQFNQVQITFPDQGKRSDIVTLRGPKNDVDKCAVYLDKMAKELVVSSYQAQVHIFKDFHKNIIGKNGAKIRQIREETETRIDLPSENSESDVITITGKKANVEAAKAKIEKIQKELASIKEISIEIPHKLHTSIIGAKGRLIRSIMDECGGVIIRFPTEGSTSDKVLIRGPEDDVENARKQLLELTNLKKEASHTTEIRAKPEYHKFLIGRGGSNIRKVREKTGARVIFPTSQDTDQEIITIIGTKDQVEKAKAELESSIKNLDNIVEGEVNVDPRHHRHFVARRGEVLRQIADEYGGVTVSFPRSGVKSERVVLKGAKDCVEGAKRRILEIVTDLDAQVTIECQINQHHHRTVMGARGANVQEITRQYEVGIKFPDRPVNGDDNIPNGEVNGGREEETEPPKRSDIIIITGKPENCEKAKAALLALVPITEEVAVPFEFHRYIIGQKGRDVRKMMEEFNVNISIPPPEDSSDMIKVTGAPNNVQRARGALEEKVVSLEKEKENRALRSFKLTFEVHPQYHPKIIGRKGAVINKIRNDYDVNVQFPDKNDENQSLITVTGFERNAIDAKEEILKMIREYEEQVHLDVKIDHRVHSRIIGAKGRGIRKLMEDFKVEIRIPRSENDDPDIIVISGSEDDVYDCRDHLLNLEEEFLQDVNDEAYLRDLQNPRSMREERQQSNPTGFVVRNAPWDKTPDTSSQEEFPSMGSVVPPKANQAWGPARKY